LAKSINQLPLVLLTKLTSLTSGSIQVAEVAKGQVIAKVKIDIGGGNIINSTITVDAIK